MSFKQKPFELFNLLLELFNLLLFYINKTFKCIFLVVYNEIKESQLTLIKLYNYFKSQNISFWQ